MSNHVSMFSSNSPLPPELQTIADDVIDAIKLDIVQGLAYEVDPNAFPSAEINPSRLGPCVMNRMREIQKESRDDTENMPALALERAYDSSVQDLVKRFGVNLVSAHSAFDQTDVVKRIQNRVAIQGMTSLNLAFTDLFDLEMDDGGDVDVKIEEEISIRSGSARRLQVVNPAISRLQNDFALSSIDSAQALFKNRTSNQEQKNISEKFSVNITQKARLLYSYSHLAFRLHRLVMLKQVNRFRADRIDAGAVATNWDEETDLVEPFRVGSFNSENRRQIYAPPYRIHQFSLSEAEYPATFNVLLAITKKNQGGFARFLKKLWEEVQDYVTAILLAAGASAGAAIGAKLGSTGGSLAGPAGAAIGAITGAVVGGIVGWLIGVMTDDIFRPKSAFVTLPTGGSNFSGNLTSPIQHLDFIDHGGHYRAFYSWQLVRSTF